MPVYRVEYKIVLEIKKESPDVARAEAFEVVVSCHQAATQGTALTAIEHLSTTDLYPPSSINVEDLVDA